MNKNRLCRKCQNKIPNREMIDGKYRNLQNRKFCLDCSPFGSHNTKPDDPSRKSSPRIDGKKPYRLYSELEKEYSRLSQYSRRRRRVRELMDEKGSKCDLCGYNKCDRALEFHHLDASAKKFEINGNTCFLYSMEDLKKEMEKCQLLCSNCHREVESQISGSRYIKYLNEDLTVNKEKWDNRFK